MRILKVAAVIIMLPFVLAAYMLAAPLNWFVDWYEGIL